MPTFAGSTPHSAARAHQPQRLDRIGHARRRRLFYRWRDRRVVRLRPEDLGELPKEGFFSGRSLDGAIFEHERGNPVGRQPAGHVVALSFHRQEAEAPAGRDDDGGAGGPGLVRREDRKGRLHDVAGDRERMIRRVEDADRDLLGPAFRSGRDAWPDLDHRRGAGRRRLGGCGARHRQADRKGDKDSYQHRRSSIRRPP
jgi:hypothetical protein